MLKDDAQKTYQTYEYLLNETNEGKIINKNKEGLTRELARINLTLNTYTQWYWKTNLHNLMNFIQLRADDHAQYEIRVYAKIIFDIMKKWVPLTSEAFERYRAGSVELSSEALEVIRTLISGKKVSQKDSNLSAREWRELMVVLNIRDT